MPGIISKRLPAPSVIEPMISPIIGILSRMLSPPVILDRMSPNNVRGSKLSNLSVIS